MNEQEYADLYKTIAGNNYDGHSSKAFGFWVQQDPHDLWAAIKTVATIEPKKILEIGVNHGGCLVFWDHLAGPGGLTAGIDDGGFIDTQIFSMYRPQHCKYNPASELHIIQGNSHREETFQLVNDLFEGSLDFLFIDGDHTYEGTKMDYEMYGPLVREGGYIAVDDIGMDTRIGRFWEELDIPKSVTSPRDKRIGIIKK